MSDLTAEARERIAEHVRQTPPPHSLPGPWTTTSLGWMWRVVAFQDGKQVVELSRYLVVEGTVCNG